MSSSGASNPHSLHSRPVSPTHVDPSHLQHGPSRPISPTHTAGPVVRHGRSRPASPNHVETPSITRQAHSQPASPICSPRTSLHLARPGFRKPPSIISNAPAASIMGGRQGSISGSVWLDPTDRYNVMVKYLYNQIKSNMWMTNLDTLGIGSSGSICAGVLLRRSRGVYQTEPADINPDLLLVVQRLNVEVAFTMATDATDVIFQQLEPDTHELIFPDGSQYQVVSSMAELANSNHVKRFQYACLVRREKLVCCWRDDVQKILVHGMEVERKLLGLVWGAPIPSLTMPVGGLNPNIITEEPPSYPLASPAPTVPQAAYFTTDQKRSNVATAFAQDKKRKSSPSILAEPLPEQLVDEEERGELVNESLNRPLPLVSAVYIGIGCTLMVMLIIGICFGKLLQESLVDGNWTRITLMITTPLLACMGLFFVFVITGNLCQLMGPIKNVTRNTRFYSATPPNLDQAEALGFERPHITIQMPVYKESLETVIKPTVNSLRAAISHYELYGGSATIFINDDGLQLISEEDAEARKEFYHDNNIAWVSRPPHGKNGFVRGGKFKKASNMNYALNFSNKVEDCLLDKVQKICPDGLITDKLEGELYREALNDVLEALAGEAWAGGNIRMGEFILIVDSDTRVPVDCLLYGAAEMFLSPEVAIVQHSAGVMQVAHDYFENGVTFFTNLIYTAIRFSVGQGEVAPFVGHNAFLRWAAIQSVGKSDEYGYQYFWSESHVSEDFDIALRLQVEGNVVRLASYHGDGFKEGVSLSLHDEIARWEKYTYGSNELVFNPMGQWFEKGPLTPLFINFMSSNVQLSSKLTIGGYIATYYAIASGLPLAILNYFLIGWFNGQLDHFYLESWKSFVSLLVIFQGLGNLSLAILRHRLREKSFLPALLETLKWIPMFSVFFSGISFHLNQAIFAHMFSFNMEWGATSKELENSNFWLEVPKIWQKFKYMYMFLFPLIGVMVYLGIAAPHGWEITEFTAIIPLANLILGHCLLPFLLNPSLMIFKY